MKSFIPTFILTLAALPALSSCSGCSETEHTEGVAAEITAAQMEGRTAARPYITSEWKDTTQLRRCLEETDSLKAPYEAAGDSRCSEAFDSAFISTIRAVRPELARTIQRVKSAR